MGLLTAIPVTAARADVLIFPGAPATQVWSGQSLNTLLGTLQQMHTRGFRGPTVPLDEETLKHINVSTGTTSGFLGLLRDGGTLHWPLVLEGPDFAAGRKRVEELAVQAYSQAHAGVVGADVVQALSAGVDALQAGLKERVDKVDANAYIQGKQFLNELEATVQVLRDPNVAKLVGGQWAARGRNVYELVQNMTHDGLRFAAATRGDEPYYAVLRQALAAYGQLPCPPAPAVG